MALGAVADDGDVLAFDQAQVRVLVIENLQDLSVLGGGENKLGG
jgi:hypothetical protein